MVIKISKFFKLYFGNYFNSYLESTPNSTPLTSSSVNTPSDKIIIPKPRSVSPLTMYNTNKSSLMQYKNLINQSKDLIKKSIDFFDNLMSNQIDNNLKNFNF